MIENRLKKCCETCDAIDVRANTIQDFSNGGYLMRTISEIYCAHEEVCKFMQRETEGAGNGDND